MSRDTKTSYTDCQGRVEAPFVSSVLPFPVCTKQDESNKSDDWQKSVRSVGITYASDTDGDYETSSEGMIPLKGRSTEIRKTQTKESRCTYFKKKSISSSKLIAFNKNVPLIKKEIISDSSHEFMENRLTRKISIENKTTHVHGSLIFASENLGKSKSMPILKNEISSNISTNFKVMDVALISDSSFAREKKMSMIIKRMTPFISSNFCDQQCKRKHEWKMMLPILCDTTSKAVINDEKSEELVAEVTFHKTKSNHRTMDWDPYRDATPTFVNDESVGNLTNDADLVDVVRNPYSSIKSVYFPPNSSDPPDLSNDFAKSKKHQRISSDVEALLKIDYELSPLRYQYSEIIGKTRALGLGGAGFDLGISCRLDQPDKFDRCALSPNEFNYHLDRDQTFLRRAATSCNFENRSSLVDNTSPSPSFSIVGKPTPTGSHIGCLNVNGSNSRQKALSFTIRDLSHTAESSNALRSCNRVRESASYLPPTSIYAFREENVLGERSCDECISNNNSQSHCKSNTLIKGTVSAWDGWPVRGRVNTNPSNILYRTEYNSHRYLNRTVENSRASRSNFFQVRKQESSVCIRIDDNWSVVPEETTNKRLKEHFEILPDDQNQTIQTEFVTRNNNQIYYNQSKNLSETERVVTNNGISSKFESKLIGHCINRDRQISRAVSASTCVPQINLNTKVCTTIEKRCISRAVSPIRDFLSTTTSANNMLVTASVSSIYVQQVHADSATKVVQKIEPSSEISFIESDKKNDAAVVTCRRDFSVQKVESQRNDLSRFPKFEKDQADLVTERKKAPHLRLSKSIADTKEKITIVPIVFTDGIPEPSRIANVNFAVPRYINKMTPRLNYQIVPFETRQSRRLPSSSNRDNEISVKNVANVADTVCLNEKLRATNEKCWRMYRTSVSRASHNSLYTQEEHHASSNVAKCSKRSTRVTTSNAGVGEKMREYYKSVPKAIPGMRSSPEDFLCET